MHQMTRWVQGFGCQKGKVQWVTKCACFILLENIWIIYLSIYIPELGVGVEYKETNKGGGAKRDGRVGQTRKVCLQSA